MVFFIITFYINISAIVLLFTQYYIRSRIMQTQTIK